MSVLRSYNTTFAVAKSLIPGVIIRGQAIHIELGGDTATYGAQPAACPSSRG